MEGYFDKAREQQREERRRAAPVQGGTRLLDREGLTPYASAAVAAELERLDRLPRPWQSGSSYWDTTTFEVACNLVELANSHWSGYGLSDAESDLRAHAPQDSAWGDRQIDKCWESARERVGGGSRPQPTPRDEVPTVTILEDAPGTTGGDATEEGPKLRRVVLTPASNIKPRPVFWLWKKRIALGTLSLLAGREGLGKSTLAYWLAARLTRGELFGEYEGRPRGVLVCATEDSWEHTIVPRLMAAGANLDRVFRVDVLNYDDIHVGLSLPRDLVAVEEAALQAEAALLLLDPLMSRLGDLDTHRDSEVRQALEPLAALADRCDMAVLGLIHHNKSGSSDPLQLVMGSKAFTAVARSVHTVVPDPDDTEGQRRLFGTPKNNLGPTDLPTFTFTIGSHCIDTEEGDAWTGVLNWGHEIEEGIDEVMARASDEEGGSTNECALWVKSYLEAQGGTAERGALFGAAKAQAFSERAMSRAGKKLKIVYRRQGFQGGTYWSLPGTLPTLDDEGEA